MKIIDFSITKRTDERLLMRMKDHYSHPKGFVGRNICYAIFYGGIYYGHIVGGSATLFLPNRNDFLGCNKNSLNQIINNIFFSVSPNPEYPFRNFTSEVVKQWMNKISGDWKDKYGDDVIGFETLVEKPRTGELYLKAGWKIIGETIGYTCKRDAGKGTDSWSGKRVWNTKELRPKTVLCYKWG